MNATAPDALRGHALHGIASAVRKPRIYGHFDHVRIVRGAPPEDDFLSWIRVVGDATTGLFAHRIALEKPGAQLGGSVESARMMIAAAGGLFEGFAVEKRGAFLTALASMARRCSEKQAGALLDAIISASSSVPGMRLPTMGIDEDQVVYLTWTAGRGRRFEVFIDRDGMFEWYASFPTAEPLGSDDPVSQMPAEAWRNLIDFSRA